MGPRTITPDRQAAAAALAEGMQQAQQAAAVAAEAEESKGEDSLEAQQAKEDADDFSLLMKKVAAGAEGIHDPDVQLAIQFMDSMDRRKKIEGRCKPLEFDSYILQGEFRQEVPVWGEDRPVIELRGLSGADHLAMRYLLTNEFSAPLIADAAQAFLIAAAGIVRIGDRHAPDLPGKGAAPEERRAAVRTRLNWVLNEPFEVVWDIYLNHLWFQARIRRAMYGKDCPF